MKRYRNMYKRMRSRVSGYGRRAYRRVRRTKKTSWMTIALIAVIGYFGYQHFSKKA